MSAADRRVLRALQLLVLGLPLFLGGRHPAGVALGLATVLALLGWTLRARARRPDPPAAIGVAPLAAFLALALLTTLPLPPALLGVLSPEAAAIYRDALPGWPDGGGWSAWRPLALHPFGTWTELCKLGIGFGAFAVLVAYPWEPAAEGFDAEDPRQHVFATLLLTMVVGGAAIGLLALVQQVAGNGRVLWMLDEVANPERASGPFVNPNHLAGWLEMAIPLGVAYLGAVAYRLGRRIARIAASSRAIGVRPRRAWAGALAANQGKLWLPLLIGAAVAIMLLAHVATGSRGGAAGLLVGLAVASGGVLSALARRERAHPALRWAPRAIAAALLLASLVTVVSWARLEEEVESGGLAGGEVSLVSRVGVAAQGRAIVRDYPLFGSGLGSWVHAFRPYQAPPVEYGLWNHAHNDYLELTAETGLVGAAIALWFGFVVAAAARRRDEPAAGDAAGSSRRGDRPAGFETAEWRAALGQSEWLRFGLAGGVAAILVHGMVDFGLRLPANLLLFFVVAGLLLLARRPLRADEVRPAWAGSSLPVAALLGLLCAAALPVAGSGMLAAFGADPRDPSALLAAADQALAEDGDVDRAVALARRAIDASPADREAHEALATALGPGPDGERALRIAIRLDPSATQIRDRLAVELWQAGRMREAQTELEESVARYPYVGSHFYPDPPRAAGAVPTDGFLRDAGAGATLRTVLAGLDAPLADAVEAGLRRVLETRPAGRSRQEVVDDLVLLLEARGRFADAGRELRAAAGPTAEDAPRLARAATNFLAAAEPEKAEEALVEALQRTPERGELYRKLAVDVLAARGDFAAAEKVLRAAQQNSQDMLPVYRGLTRVLSMRETARLEAAARLPAEPGERYAEAALLDGPAPGVVPAAAAQEPLASERGDAATPVTP